MKQSTTRPHMATLSIRIPMELADRLAAIRTRAETVGLGGANLTSICTRALEAWIAQAEKQLALLEATTRSLP